MRICLVSRELAPFFGGGIGTYISHASRALAEAGHEVHILTDRHPRLEGVSALRWGAKIHRVDLSRPEASIHAYALDSMQYAMAVHVALEEIHATHQFDFIEFPEWGGEGYFSLRARRYLGALPGAVLAVRLHTPSRECRLMNRRTWLDRAAVCLDHIEDESVCLADLVLSPCATLMRRVQSRLGPRPVNQVVPHPLYHDGPIMPAAEQPGRVLYFGRIEHRKGVHLLIHAAQMLLEEGVDLHVDLVGRDTLSGPCRTSLQAYLEEQIDERWRDRIRFHGAKPFDELKTFMSHAAVCCFPTLAEWENFPNTCLEAMAVGSVIVASDALAEILADGETGLLFPTNEAPQLAKVLKTALSDAALRDRLRLAARRHVASLCDPALYAQRVEQVFRQVAPSVAVPNARSAGHRAPDPDVTVIVTQNEGDEHLASTLASVRAQTTGVNDVFVVATHSSPGVSQAAATYGATRHQTRPRNLASLRNIGLSLGTGRWVLFLDSGDRLAPRFIETMLLAIGRDPATRMAASLSAFFKDEPGDLATGWCPWGDGIGWIVGSHPAARGGVLVRRGLAQDAGGYDEWVGGACEWDLYCTLDSRGANTAIVPEFLFERRMDGSTDGSRMDAWLEGQAALIAKHSDLASHESVVARILLGDLRQASANGGPSLARRVLSKLDSIVAFSRR
jgi:glycosyltransferase involved in cell wall biosynthesis